MDNYEFTTMASLTGANGAQVEGMIIKKTTGSYTVQMSEHVLTCEVDFPDERASRADCSKKGRLQSAHREKPIARSMQRVTGIEALTVDLAVGDRVQVQPISAERGRITARLPRRNELARRAAGWKPGKHANHQVIAANLDRVAAVFAAAQPPPKWSLLDRYLVSAEAANIPALICLTKADLVDDLTEIETALDEYRRIGYPVIVTSAASGQGLAELRRALENEVTAMVGKSGVGKTSLLNALQPGLGLRVRTVSQSTEKGRHTTTHQELFALDSGGALIDTPGMREFGLWDVDESDLALYFPEMRPYLGRCKFGLGCRHDGEPGCAVRRAVVAGEISPRRYKSFQRLRLAE